MSFVFPFFHCTIKGNFCQAFSITKVLLTLRAKSTILKTISMVLSQKSDGAKNKSQIVETKLTTMATTPSCLMMLSLLLNLIFIFVQPLRFCVQESWKD
jgi:hypothetical protein